MHTLENIIDWVEANIHTQACYDALPQETRDLHIQAINAYNAQMEAQNDWNAECARLDRKEEAAAERARLEAIWDACDRGCSESPSGAW